jgi:DNA-binding MarR family transcriptional regulator
MKREKRPGSSAARKVALSTEDIDEALSISELISLTKDAFDKARQKELNPINLHLRWGAIIWAIRSLGDEATLIKIAQLTARKPHTISHMLSKLEHAGMILRIRDMDRKNGVRAVLTDMGNDIFEKLNNRKSVQRIISSLSSSDQKQMIEYLETLCAKAREFIGTKQETIPSFPDQLYYHLFRLVVDTEGNISQAKEIDLTDINIGVRRDAVLGAIETLGTDTSPSAIARHLQRQCNSITHILAKMEEEGLIKYVKHPKLRKRKIVTLTPGGYQKYLASRTGKIVPEIILSLPGEKRRRLKLYLELLHQSALQEIAH